MYPEVFGWSVIAVDRRMETFGSVGGLTLTPGPSPGTGEGSQKSGFQSLASGERDFG